LDGPKKTQGKKNSKLKEKNSNLKPKAKKVDTFSKNSDIFVCKNTSFMRKTYMSKLKKKLKVKTQKVGTFRIPGCRKSVQIKA